MNLVIDANILLAALINPSGTTQNIIFDDDIKLFAPEFLLEEFLKHKEIIVKKSKLSSKEVTQAANILESRISTIPRKLFENEREEAKLFSPDQDDIEYLGLASFLSCPLWSNDKVLKRQDQVQVITTEELVKIISENS